jgi:hypothetical protein
VNERLEKLARRITDEVGVIVPRDRLPEKLARRFDELREELTLVRCLGIDVTPKAIGADAASLTAALRGALERDDDDAAERARRDAVRRLRATARSRPFGRARESIATSLALLLGRVATSKGSVAEALSAAALRFRSAASEAGARLVERGILEEADDAMYLYRNEIEEALGGEPGAYAARVRFRREDDERWRALTPPRRIG